MGGCTLGQVLHGSATTTEAIRRAIQRSQESLRTLAKRHGINPKTVAKWKKRSFVADLPTGPKQPSSTVLSIEEEARDYQEFRAEVGHDRSKGARRCRDAKNLAYPMPCSINYWLAPTPKRLSIRMDCWMT